MENQLKYKKMLIELNSLAKKYVLSSDLLELRLIKWLEKINQFGKALIGNIQFSDEYLSDYKESHNNIQFDNPLKLYANSIKYTLDGPHMDEISNVKFDIELTNEIASLMNKLNIDEEEFIKRSLMVPVGVGTREWSSLSFYRLNGIDILLFNDSEKKEKHIFENHGLLSEATRINY